MKKNFDDGIYTARVIPDGDWDEGWEWLHEWVSENEK